MPDLPDVTAPLSVAARPEKTGGQKIGVLISHGFTGSPASTRPWGEFLAERGYAVEVPRLPGHGSTWQEMNTTNWSDWYGEVRRAFDKLLTENDLVVAAGLSMGGALVMRLAADVGERVAGLILVNPAVATQRKDVLALPALKWVLGSLPGIGNDIAKPGVDEHGYDRTPLRAAHSMMQAWKPLRADLGRIHAPVLYFKSTVDNVVDPSSMQIIRAKIGSTDFTVRELADSLHVATLDHDAETIFTESVDFIARVTAPA